MPKCKTTGEPCALERRSAETQGPSAQVPLQRAAVFAIALGASLGFGGCCCSVTEFDRVVSAAVAWSALGIGVLGIAGTAVSILVAVSGRRTIVPFLVSIPFALVAMVLALLTLAYCGGALYGQQPFTLYGSAGAVTWSAASLLVYLVVHRRARGEDTEASAPQRISPAGLAGAVVVGSVWLAYMVGAIALLLVLKLPPHRSIVELSISPEMPCALYDSGQVACWPHRNLDYPVVEDAVSVSTAGHSGCAVQRSGEVVCWDHEYATQHPARAGVTGATQVAVGWGFQCARLQDSTVSCWGKNASGQLGNGSTADSTTPVKVKGLDGAAEIAVGKATACAVRHAGNVLCWGGNSSGQLGDGAAVPKDDKPRSSAEPIEVVSLSDARKVTVGGSHACAWRRTGEVVCWGEGGLLGDGTEDTSSVPAVVTGLCEVADLQAGDDHTCVRCSAGEVMCWGWNSLGAVGAPDKVTQVHAIRVALPGAAERIDVHDSHTCARVGGRYWCWGDSTYDQLGVGSREGCGADLLVKPLCTPQPAQVELW